MIIYKLIPKLKDIFQNIEPGRINQDSDHKSNSKTLFLITKLVLG